jgi:hypothetical protein
MGTIGIDYMESGKYSHMWCALLSKWCALLLLASSPLGYKTKHSPLAKLVGAWVILLVDVIVIFLSHWNKKALEATTWCKAILCGSSMFNFI